MRPGRPLPDDDGTNEAKELLMSVLRTHPTDPDPDRRIGRRRHRPRGWIAIVAAAAMVFALVGCGSSDSKADPATTRGAGDSSAASTDGPDNAVTVTTPGMSFEVSGPLRPGVATITLENTDDVTHMMAIARLKDGVTLDKLESALQQDGEDASMKLLAESPPPALGTPAMVGPGRHSTVTATDLEAGTYALICFLTDDSGKPHLAMGMVGQLKVEGRRSPPSPAPTGPSPSTTRPSPFPTASSARARSW